MANQVIKGCGHHHVALYVSDFDRSMEFYTKALGFVKLNEWLHKGERVSMLDVGDGTILEMFASKKLAENPGKLGGGLYWHLCFKADDVDAAYNAAIAGGATKAQEPMDITIADAMPAPFQLRNAFVIGFDGESIEFFKG